MILAYSEEMSHFLAFEFAVLAGDRERCRVNVCCAPLTLPSITSSRITHSAVCTAVYLIDFLNGSVFDFN